MARPRERCLPRGARGACHLNRSSEWLGWVKLGGCTKRAQRKVRHATVPGTESGPTHFWLDRCGWVQTDASRTPPAPSCRLLQTPGLTISGHCQVVLSCPTRIPAHCSAGNCAQLRLCSTLSHSFTFFSPSAQTVHSDTPRDTAAHSSGTATLEPPTDLRLGVALSLLFTLELSTFRPHTLDTTRTFALPFLPLLSAADRTYQLCFTTTRSPPLTRP